MSLWVNPHAVFFVPRITDELVQQTGPLIERHPHFPERTNVEFVEVRNRDEVTMRVYRSAARAKRSLAAPDACVVCVAGVLNRLINRTVTVHLRGGDLAIKWSADNHVL